MFNILWGEVAMATPFYDKIHNSPVIAAVGDIEKLDQAIESPCEIVFC